MQRRRQKQQSGFVRPWLAAGAAVSTTAIVATVVLMDAPKPKEAPPVEPPVLQAGISGTGNVQPQAEQVAVIQYPFGPVPFSTDLVITELELKNANNTKDFRVAGISGTGDRIFIYLDNKPLLDLIPTDGTFDITINVPTAGQHNLKFYRVDENNKPAYSSAPVQFEVQATPETKTLSQAPVPAAPLALAFKPLMLDSFVPSLHTANMVMLHGEGEPNQMVEIVLNGHPLQTTRIDKMGKWKATINAGKAGKHYLAMRYIDNANAPTKLTREVIVRVEAFDKPQPQSSLRSIIKKVWEA